MWYDFDHWYLYKFSVLHLFDDLKELNFLFLEIVQRKWGEAKPLNYTFIFFFFIILFLICFVVLTYCWRDYAGMQRINVNVDAFNFFGKWCYVSALLPKSTCSIAWDMKLMKRFCLVHIFILVILVFHLDSFFHITSELYWTCMQVSEKILWLGLLLAENITEQLVIM